MLTNTTLSQSMKVQFYVSKVIQLDFLIVRRLKKKRDGAVKVLAHHLLLPGEPDTEPDPVLCLLQDC